MQTSLRQIIRIALISSGLLFALPGQAAQPDEASLLKLADVMHIEGMFSQMAENAVSPQVIGQIVANTLKNRPGHQAINAQQRQQLEDIFKKIETGLFKTINTPTLRQQLKHWFVASAQQIYTQQEVDAMLAFYGNPTGQSILKKQPELMKAYAEKITPVIVEVQQEFMRKQLPQLKQEIEKVFKETQEK